METFPGWVGVRTRRTCGSFAGQSGRGLNVQDWEAEGENGGAKAPGGSVLGVGHRFAGAGRGGGRKGSVCGPSLPG